MSDVDPNKMKVVELRSELSVRGLDTKGNKAQLVKRMKVALSKEDGAVAGDETATDSVDLDTSYESQEDTKNDSQMEAEDELLKADEDILKADEDILKADEDILKADEDIQDIPNSEVLENDDKILEGGENETVAADDTKINESEILNDEITENGSVAHDEAQPAESTEKPKTEIKTEKVDDATESQEGAGDEEKNDDVEMKEGESKNAEIKEEDSKDVEMKDESKDESKGDGKDESKDEKREGDDGENSSKRNRAQKRRRSRSRDRREKEKTEPFVPPELEDLQEFDASLTVLDIYVSDLNLKLSESRCGGTPLLVDGFAFMWGGAKAIYGVKEGKICYEVKLTKNEEVKHLPSTETNTHVLRVGFSDLKAGLQLGEEPLSYGYGGTGKFSTDCNFEDYGKTFTEGDVVQCFLDMDSDPMQLSYSVNGEHLGIAKEIAKENLEDLTLFPHILTKNTSFEVNFGQNEEPFFPIPDEYKDFTFIQGVDLTKLVRGPVCPEKKEDCEMIMMCGLPGAGKTHWVKEHVENNPDKRYTVLGTNSIIDKMKVMGLARKKNYSGRWDVLIDKATGCLNKMFDVAFRRRRNYILDQTNVYASAQRRKMRPFECYQRKAVVVIPTDDEFKARIANRIKEEEKDIPDHAVLEMKASFSMPKVGEWFSSVEFTDLKDEEAQKLVDQYRKDGQAATPRKRFRRDDRRPGNNRDNRRRDNRGPRNFGNNQNRNRGPRPQGNRSWSSGGSNNNSAGGNRNSGNQARGWSQGNQGRSNWGNRSEGQGYRNWSQGSNSSGGGNHMRRGFGGGGGSWEQRDSRDNYRAPQSRPQAASRYPPQPARFSNNRPAPPMRGYGGSPQQSQPNYPQHQPWSNQQPWNNGGGQWGSSSSGSGSSSYYQQQNHGYYK